MPFPDLTPLVSALGHHPFDGRYDAGCGLLGSTLTDADLAEAGDDVRSGPVRVVPDPNMTSAAILRTWVLRPGSAVDCVAVADGDGRVIGVGRNGYPAPPAVGPGVDGLWGIAPLGADSYRLVVRFEGSDQLVALPAGTPP